MQVAATLQKFRLLVALALMTVLIGGGCLRRSEDKPNQLTYQLPVKLTIAMNGELPGTGIRYQGMDDQGAHLFIEGQQALKRKGDSLGWKGTPVPDVAVDLETRVIWYTEKEIYLVGTAKVVIDNTSPQPVLVSPAPQWVSYSGPVVYSVNKGEVIPGSTLAYEGRTDEGAKLGGLEGYSYRKVGDSVLWEGKLHNGVYSRLDARIVQYDDKGMRIGGIVTLWIGS